MATRLNKSSHSQIPEDMWKLTLSDLLTLLLAFFVLRFSTLTFEMAPTVSFPGADSHEGSATPPESNLESANTAIQSEGASGGCYTDGCRAVTDRLEVALGGAVTRHGADTEFEHTIGVRSTEFDTEIVLGRGTFPSGSDELTFGAFRAVMAISRGLNARPTDKAPARIEITGYADEAPERTLELAVAADKTANSSVVSNSTGGSSWDLANARALTVTRQMLDAGIDSNLISINGFGARIDTDNGQKDQSVWDDPRVVIRIIDVPQPNKPVAGQ
jgi:flagellar motor protein MotB